jgi:hypothetical protein
MLEALWLLCEFALVADLECQLAIDCRDLARVKDGEMGVDGAVRRYGQSDIGRRHGIRHVEKELPVPDEGSGLQRVGCADGCDCSDKLLSLCWLAGDRNQSTAATRSSAGTSPVRCPSSCPS